MDGNVAFCDAVAKGYYNPIRKTQREYARKALLVLLPKLSDLFGGRHQIKEEVLAACVEIVLRNFSHLGLEELSVAYELHHRDKLDARDAEMYGGIFNAANMTKILTAYTKYRQKLIAHYLRLTEVAATEKAEKERQDQKRQQFLAGIPAEIEAKRPRIQSWKDIPVYWFEACIELKIFKRPVDSEPIRQLQKKAKIAAELELRKIEECGNSDRPKINEVPLKPWTLNVIWSAGS